MKTSFTTCAAGLLASIVITFTTVYLAAEYAYPDASAVQLAKAPK